MSELKPCPICGATLKIYSPEDWKPTFYDPDINGIEFHGLTLSRQIVNPQVGDCGFQFSNGSYNYAEFVAALNRRAEPANEPLTCNGCAYEPLFPAEEHCFGCARMYVDHYAHKPGGELT